MHHSSQDAKQPLTLSVLVYMRTILKTSCNSLVIDLN